MSKRSMLVLLVVFSAMAIAMPKKASAQVSVGVVIGRPVPRPVIVAPEPVVVESAPVVVAPEPYVVVRPRYVYPAYSAPVVVVRRSCPRPYYYGYRDRGWDHGWHRGWRR